MRTELPAFDELNNIRLALGETVFAMMREAGRLARKRIEDMIFELLTMGYVYGVELAGLDLEADIPVDRARMREVAYEPTAGENFAQRIADHVEAAEAAIAELPDTAIEVLDHLITQISVVAETETHRVINAGILDGGEWYVRHNPGETVYKTWVTMRDDRVRDTHYYLDGATVPMDARFYAYDGDSARFPGDFLLPENNVHCRCLIRLA